MLARSKSDAEVAGMFDSFERDDDDDDGYGTLDQGQSSTLKNSEDLQHTFFSSRVSSICCNVLAKKIMQRLFSTACFSHFDFGLIFTPARRQWLR